MLHITPQKTRCFNYQIWELLQDNPFQIQHGEVHIKQCFVYLPVLEIIIQTTQFQSFMKHYHYVLQMQSVQNPAIK